MTSLFTQLLEAPAPGPVPNLETYLRRVAAIAAPRDASVAQAALAGVVADRMGYAFAGGYTVAIRRLVPNATRACLCVTEAGGGHPSAMHTRLSPREGGFTLTGVKTFATLAQVADELLVVATEGTRNGRNALRVVRVPRARAGVTMRDLPPVAFAPEIPHAEVRFDDVVVSSDEVLEGDGYDRYVKPFRTIEDVHVLAATLGYLVGCARAYVWPREAVEAIFAELAALVTLGACAPLDRGVHVALAGVLAAARERIDDLAPHWASAPDDARDRWLRDKPLLHIADRARAARSEAAWARGG